MSGGGGYFGEPWTDRVLTEWLLSVQVQTANDAARSLLNQAGSQLPKSPRNYSVASGLAASNGDDSASSVNLGAGLAPPTDPVWTRAPLVAEPFDGVNLSPSQTGYDPAERGAFAKGVTRQRSTLRASAAGSVRAAAQHLTPPQLDRSELVASDRDSGTIAPPAPTPAPAPHKAAVRSQPAVHEGEQRLQGSVARAAAPTPIPADAAAAAVPDLPASADEGCGSNGAAGELAAACDQVPPVAVGETPGPPRRAGRAANGALRVGVPQGSRPQSRAPSAHPEGHDSQPADAVHSPAAPPTDMPLSATRGAGGAARFAQALTPPRLDGDEGNSAASSSLSGTAARAVGDGAPKVLAAPQEAAGGAQGVAYSQSGLSERHSSHEARGGVGMNGVAGTVREVAASAPLCIGEEEGSSAQTGVGEARMRAGRAFATFLRASRAGVVLNDAWRESVASELPTTRAGSTASGSQGMQARAEVIQSLLANNAEALEAIANGGAGLPLHVGESDGARLQESPGAVAVAAGRGSMAMSEARRPTSVVERAPVDRQAVPAQGFFVDVDPSEYRGLHHGFDDAVTSRSPRSVGSQSASSQRVWWNRP